MNRIILYIVASLVVSTVFGQVCNDPLSTNQCKITGDTTCKDLAATLQDCRVNTGPIPVGSTADDCHTMSSTDELCKSGNSYLCSTLPNNNCRDASNGKCVDLTVDTTDQYLRSDTSKECGTLSATECRNSGTHIAQTITAGDCKLDNNECEVGITTSSSICQEEDKSCYDVSGSSAIKCKNSTGIECIKYAYDDTKASDVDGKCVTIGNTQCRKSDTGKIQALSNDICRDSLGECTTITNSMCRNSDGSCISDLETNSTHCRSSSDKSCQSIGNGCRNESDKNLCVVEASVIGANCRHSTTGVCQQMSNSLICRNNTDKECVDTAPVTLCKGSSGICHSYADEATSDTHQAATSNSDPICTDLANNFCRTSTSGLNTGTGTDSCRNGDNGVCTAIDTNSCRDSDGTCSTSLNTNTTHCKNSGDNSCENIGTGCRNSSNNNICITATGITENSCRNTNTGTCDTMTDSCRNNTDKSCKIKNLVEYCKITSGGNSGGCHIYTEETNTHAATHRAATSDPDPSCITLTTDLCRADTGIQATITTDWCKLTDGKCYITSLDDNSTHCKHPGSKTCLEIGQGCRNTTDNNHCILEADLDNTDICRSTTVGATQGECTPMGTLKCRNKTDKSCKTTDIESFCKESGGGCHIYTDETISTSHLAGNASTNYSCITLDSEHCRKDGLNILISTQCKDSPTANCITPTTNQCRKSDKTCFTGLDDNSTYCQGIDANKLCTAIGEGCRNATDNKCVAKVSVTGNQCRSITPGNTQGECTTMGNTLCRNDTSKACMGLIPATFCKINAGGSTGQCHKYSGEASADTHQAAGSLDVPVCVNVDNGYCRASTGLNTAITTTTCRISNTGYCSSSLESNSTHCKSLSDNSCQLIGEGCRNSTTNQCIAKTSVPSTDCRSVSPALLGECTTIPTGECKNTVTQACSGDLGSNSTHCRKADDQTCNVIGEGCRTPTTNLCHTITIKDCKEATTNICSKDLDISTKCKTGSTNICYEYSPTNLFTAKDTENRTCINVTENQCRLANGTRINAESIYCRTSTGDDTCILLDEIISTETETETSETETETEVIPFTGTEYCQEAEKDSLCYRINIYKGRISETNPQCGNLARNMHCIDTTKKNIVISIPDNNCIGEEGKCVEVEGNIGNVLRNSVSDPTCVTISPLYCIMPGSYYQMSALFDGGNEICDPRAADGLCTLITTSTIIKSYHDGSCVQRVDSVKGMSNCGLWDDANKACVQCDFGYILVDLECVGVDLPVADRSSYIHLGIGIWGLGLKMKVLSKSFQSRSQIRKKQNIVKMDAHRNSIDFIKSPQKAPTNKINPQLSRKIKQIYIKATSSNPNNPLFLNKRDILPLVEPRIIKSTPATRKAPNILLEANVKKQKIKRLDCLSQIRKKFYRDREPKSKNKSEDLISGVFINKVRQYSSCELESPKQPKIPFPIEINSPKNINSGRQNDGSNATHRGHRTMLNSMSEQKISSSGNRASLLFPTGEVHPAILNSTAGIARGINIHNKNLPLKDLAVFQTDLVRRILTSRKEEKIVIGIGGGDSNSKMNNWEDGGVMCPPFKLDVANSKNKQNSNSELVRITSFHPAHNLINHVYQTPIKRGKWEVIHQQSTGTQYNVNIPPDYSNLRKDEISNSNRYTERSDGKNIENEGEEYASLTPKFNTPSNNNVLKVGRSKSGSKNYVIQPYISQIYKQKSAQKYFKANQDEKMFRKTIYQNHSINTIDTPPREKVPLFESRNMPLNKMVVTTTDELNIHNALQNETSREGVFWDNNAVNENSPNSPPLTVLKRRSHTTFSNFSEYIRPRRSSPGKYINTKHFDFPQEKKDSRNTLGKHISKRHTEYNLKSIMKRSTGLNRSLEESSKNSSIPDTTLLPPVYSSNNHEVNIKSLKGDLQKTLYSAIPYRLKDPKIDKISADLIGVKSKRKGRNSERFMRGEDNNNNNNNNNNNIIYGTHNHFSTESKSNIIFKSAPDLKEFDKRHHFLIAEGEAVSHVQRDTQTQKHIYTENTREAHSDKQPSQCNLRERRSMSMLEISPDLGDTGAHLHQVSPVKYLRKRVVNLNQSVGDLSRGDNINTASIASAKRKKRLKSIIRRKEKCSTTGRNKLKTAQYKGKEVFIYNSVIY